MKEDIAGETLELALKYVDEAEVYLEKEDKIEVNVQNQKVDFAKEISSYGLGIRVINEGSMGFAHTTDLSNLEKTVENAVFNAKCNEADPNFYFTPQSKYPEVYGIYDKRSGI